MNILEILGKIGFDWRMALANLVNFFIIFWLLKRYAFGPISRILEDRKKKIEQGLEDAKKAERDKIMAQQKFEEIVTRARQEADSIVSRAQEQSKEIIQHAMQRAEEKVRQMVQEARGQISKDRQRMEKEIQTQAARVALLAAERILQKEFTQKEEEKYLQVLFQKEK